MPPTRETGTRDPGALARLRAVSTSLREEHDRWRGEAVVRAAAREAAARRGDLGPGARELQARVDAGLTSWPAVLDGRDRSAAAEEARRHVEGRLAALAASAGPTGPTGTAGTAPPGEVGVRGP